MQDRIYQSELKEKVKFLNVNEILPDGLHEVLIELIENGDYNSVDDILKPYEYFFIDQKSTDKNAINRRNDFNNDKLVNKRVEMLKNENIKLGQELNRRTREFSKIDAQKEFKINELEKLYNDEIRNKVKENVPSYVTTASAQLTEKENKLKKIATIWSLIGFIALILAVAFASFSIVWGYKEFSALPLERITWMWISFGLIKGASLLIMLFGIAVYALNLSKAYMHESLKLSDRIHAINLGEVYLKIYGHSVSSQEFKDIFENWNISSNSAFYTKPESSDYNKAILQKALEEALPTQLIKNFVSMKSLSKE
ncbi:TPA: MnhB domain-containing protein [Yersinia enterocolitica]|nr:MnhB domain-containing protein [Yersinia enterocolitica]HEN3238840.1 MnhB domain-containing protein [Yersinia enterocolitica]HEN3316451.1 MnhB domain-containing protein [Yersinia enterocolitica]